MASWLPIHLSPIDPSQIIGGTTARVYFTHSLGDATNITNGTATLTWRDSSDNVVLSLNSDDDAAQWTINDEDGDPSYVELVQSDTINLTAGTYSGDIRIDDASGDTHVVERGSVEVILMVSRTSDPTGALVASYDTLLAQADATDAAYPDLVATAQALQASMQTILGDDAATSATTIEVDDPTNFKEGHEIIIELDSGDWHETTISDLIGFEFTIADALPSAASADNRVWLGRDLS